MSFYNYYNFLLYLFGKHYIIFYNKTMIALNRNKIKLIALITMLIDHIGVLLQYAIPYWLYCCFRLIGRISFPIFAYFIAEGCYFSKNKIKYLCTIYLFALISQIPYYLFFGFNPLNLNVLFTFTFSIIIIFVFDKFLKMKTEIKPFVLICLIFTLLFIYLILNVLGLYFEYGLYGILLPILFYYSRSNKALQIFLFVLIFLLQFTIKLTLNLTEINSLLITLTSLLSSPFILLYNNTKGKLNLKYLFYYFLHPI